MMVVLLSLPVFSQQTDTLKVMVYNILNYRNTTNQCTNTTNDPSAKESDLRTLFLYYKPDVLVCNEIGAQPTNNYAFIQDNVLNVNGETAYRSANYSNNSFSSLTNMLYYNSEKIGLLKQEAVTRGTNNQFLVRVIDIYHLYYKDPNLTAGADTVKFTVIAAHLKAGDSPSDRAERADMAEALMDYLSSRQIQGNVMVMGDFNLYSSTEGAYQQLTNYSNTAVRFYDPVDKPGNWSGSSTYKLYHTQSTRSNNTNGGCFSSGGMDDRFDFILTQFPVLAPNNEFRYIENSYQAIGQDGTFFNQAFDVNQSNLPTPVAQAIYDISDHLPVKMEVEVDRLQGVGMAVPTLAIWHPTLVDENLLIHYEADLPQGLFTLYQLDGRPVAQQAGGQGQTAIALGHLAPGMYVLTYQSPSSGIIWRSKLLVK